MKTTNFFDLVGVPIAGRDLRSAKALALHTLLRQGPLSFARLLEARRVDQHELLMVDIEPELPQRPVHDIRAVERFVIWFSAKAGSLPRVLALRQDFPVVPHLNLTARAQPKDLCLSELPAAEQQLTWTPAGLLVGLAHWLRLTARGELHGTTQALEPVFFPSHERVLVPSAFFEVQPQPLPARLQLQLVSQTPTELVYRASAPGTGPVADQAVPLLGFSYQAGAQLHGLIQEQPETLADLHRLLLPGGDDFCGSLRQLLAQWVAEGVADLHLPLLGLVRVPKRRDADTAPEVVEVWAFATTDSAQQVSEALGATPAAESNASPPSINAVKTTGQEVKLYLLNPAAMLTPDKAAEYNGLPAATATAYVVVGVGSLGSQLVTTLHKAGQGTWLLLDEDVELPHNPSRHQLGGRHVGRAKAEALAEELNLLYETPRVSYRVVDVLQAADELAASYAAADVVLDTSASVAVARHLALDVSAPARRISVFLNPTGADLVVLAESADRTLRLDYLEMEYYRALTTQSALAQHLASGEPAIRYANGCRDKSARIPQDQVALLAAVGTRAVRTASDSREAQVKIWQTQPDLTVSALVVPPVRYRQARHPGGWTLHISTRLLRAMADHRATRLGHSGHQFRETGGVLLGLFDTQRRQLYIVDQLLAPADSQERRDSFIRGTEGLVEKVAEIRRLTNSQLDYVGEWHSHPPRHNTRPSTDDRRLFTWLCDHRAADGLPAVMAIVGDDANISWYVGDLTQGRAHTTQYKR